MSSVLDDRPSHTSMEVGGLSMFGVVVVLMMEAGLITPPVGLNVFVIAGVAKDVPMSTIFRGALPFLIGMIVVVAIIITAFPIITLLLPKLM